MFMIRCEILGHFPYGTRGLPKCPKMAVAEIGHSHEYASRCQNASFQRGTKKGHFGIGMHSHASGLFLSQPFWGILATLVYIIYA